MQGTYFVTQVKEGLKATAKKESRQTTQNQKSCLWHNLILYVYNVILRHQCSHKKVEKEEVWP